MAGIPVQSRAEYLASFTSVHLMMASSCGYHRTEKVIATLTPTTVRSKIGFSVPRVLLILIIWAQAYAITFRILPPAIG